MSRIDSRELTERWILEQMDPKSEARADHRSAQLCQALHQTGFAGARDASIEDFTPRYLTSNERAKLEHARRGAGWAALAAHSKALRDQEGSG